MARGCLTCQKPVQSGFASVQRPKKGARRRLQSIRRKKEGKKQKYNPAYGRRREKENDTQHHQNHRGNRQQDGTNIKQEHQLQDLYGIELSAEMVSKITDKILPQVKEWQSRPLNPVYPFVFMDCIHYKVREDGRILSRAAYVVLGVTVEGYKDILSITVGANETSKFWLGMLNDLKNRGVKDVLFFCVDGLPGFKEAIQAVYPQAEIQRCVIHMLRNSFKYVNYNDLKKFSSDFKEVYNAPNETAALTELENMKEKWGKKYPYAISNWENNWEDVSSFFQFSNDIRVSAK